MLFKISIRIPYEIYHEILFCTKIVVSLTANAFEKMYVIKVFLANTTDLIIRFLLYNKKGSHVYALSEKRELLSVSKNLNQKKISCYYENFTVIIYYKMNTQCAIWDYILFQTLWRWKEFSFVVQCGYMRDPFFILVIKIHIMCLQFFFSFQTLLSFQPK